MSKAEGAALAGVVVLALAWTGFGARSIGTWAMEVVWAVAGLVLVLAVRRRFPLTRLLCWLLVLHALVLCYGGQYTYAETPLGEWVQHWLGTQRNNYDRFAHFVQGFVPAIAVREVLLRRSPLTPGRWSAFLTVCVCLSISACFEFVEWASALLMGGNADDFLATQGDPWDTQWDMFLCVCGALVSLALLSRRHDRQLSTTV
ncbi:Inner membrane protein YjdF [Amycolatopsis sp. CA-230715]|nr:Inner membrane protein YjdF [Amycolatopsis sp. CA-230715]